MARFWDTLKKYGSQADDFILGMFPAAKDIRDSLVAGEYAKNTDKWLKDKEEQTKKIKERMDAEKDPAKKAKIKEIYKNTLKEENPYQYMYDEVQPTLQKSKAQFLADALATGVNVATTASGAGVIKGVGGKMITQAAAKELTPSLLNRGATQAGLFGVQSAATGYGETGREEDLGKNMLIGMGEGVLFGEIPGIRSRAKRVLAAGAIGVGGAAARGETDPTKLAQAGALTGGFQAGGEVLNAAGSKTMANQGAEATPILGDMRKAVLKYSDKFKIKGEGTYGDYASVENNAIRNIGKEELVDLMASGNIRPIDGKHVNVFSGEEQKRRLMEETPDMLQGKDITVVFKPKVNERLKGGGEGEISYVKGPIGWEDIEKVIIPDRNVLADVGTKKGFINLGADLKGDKTPEGEQTKSMVDNLSPEDKQLLTDKTEEMRSLQSIIDEVGPEDPVSIDAGNRIKEIQTEINNTIGEKAKIKSLDTKDFHTVMAGEEHANKIVHAQEGQLIKDLNEAGLADNPPDNKVVEALNSKGWSFDNADEVAQALLKERGGERVTPQQHTEQKINDWLIDEGTYNTEGAYQVMAEMENAQAGFRRAGAETGVGMDRETISAPSSFPDWVPESLRKRQLFDAVAQHIDDGTEPKGSAQRELYDVVNAEIRKREGLPEPTQTLLDREVPRAIKRPSGPRIILSKEIPENQIDLLKVTRRTDIDPQVKVAIKSDLQKYGKVSDANMEMLKDELYASKRLDTNFAIKEEYHSYNELQKQFDKAGMEMPDDIKRIREEKIVERVLSTVRGDASRVIDRLEKLGVRKEIINSARIQNEHPLGSAVKIKREKTGEVSAVIDKSLLDYIAKNIKGVEKDKKWISRYSPTAIKKLAGEALAWWEIPQQFFKRTGLKEVIYDPIRTGERNAEIFRVESKNKLKDTFGKLTKDERAEVTRFFATKQGKGKDIEAAGMKPMKFTDLNDAQKKAVGAWDRFRKDIEPQIVSLARNHGTELETIDWYFPLYTHKDTIKVGGENMMEDMGELIRKEPFFKSLKEREEKVPFKLYEQDSWKLIDAYVNGASRFLKVGEKTLPIKYLIDSDQFAKLAGNEIQSTTRSWLKEITSPKSSPDPVESVLRILRKGAYRSILGLNPRTIAKQAISYLDVGLIDGLHGQDTALAKKLAGGTGYASVLERVPDISMADISDNVDKALLGGITYTDKFVAKGNLANVLAGELTKAKKASKTGKLDNTAIRGALKNASDKIDLAMGGVTPAQRAKIYRSEAGKLFGMFTSTINSRFQYYIENTAQGIKKKDAALLAKVATSFFLSAYAEVAITKLALSSGDAITDAKDILRSAAGNIPMVGSFIFAMDSDKWNPSPAIQNVSDAVAGISKAKSGEVGDIMGAVARIAEVAGLPKQLRRSVEGYQEFGGIRETIGGKYIDYDKTQGKSSSGSSSVMPSVSRETKRRNRVKQQRRKRTLGY